MKNLTKYLSASTNCFFNYLKDNNELNLKITLTKIENLCRKESNNINATLNFKFGKNDTLVYSINEILNDLSNQNRNLLLENFNRISKDTNPNNELILYFN